ncbi:MAG: pimeloyl-ACP methyl ester carboxylesterase [Bradymonadia bacterium]|jgi:pimeloyl-ACP methyl ester carboxylesterase
MFSRLLLSTLVLSLLPSCAALRSATDPLTVVEHELTDAPNAGLIVLFPGYGDRPRRFERADFIDIIGEHAADFDVVALDAHFGYYRTGTVIERVYEDVLAPAVEAGVDEIWLVGISMGGAGAISTANEHADIIDGVIALAPYLGPPNLVQEISDAGGLMAWEPGDIDSMPDDRASFFRRQWAWLQGYGNGAERPELRLGVGADDRLFTPASMVAAVLPENAYEVLDGGHNWQVWTPLFTHFLEMGL